MPSSSKSAGFSSRAVICSYVVAIGLLVPDSRLRRGAYPPCTCNQRRNAVPYELPELPYAYDALEPTIDEQTMRIHYGKHHQAYVDNLNKALDGTEWDGRPLEAVLANLTSLPEDKQMAVRNNGGGHANHSLFWQIMKPGGGGEPTGDLAAEINDLWGDTY